MQRLEVSGAVRPLLSSLGVKGLNAQLRFVQLDTHLSRELPVFINQIRSTLQHMFQYFPPFSITTLLTFFISTCFPQRRLALSYIPLDVAEKKSQVFSTRYSFLSSKN